MLTAEIVDTAEARYGDSDNSVYDAAEWLEFVNDAYMEVVAAHPSWPFLESRSTSLSLAAQAAGVSLPTDVWRVTAVYNDTANLPLAPIYGQAQYRQAFPEPDVGFGIPLFYRLRSNYLEVYPRPESTTSLVLDILVSPAVLEFDDTPVFPVQYHRMLVLGALVRANEDDGNLQQASYYEGRFQRILQSMKNDLLSPRHEGYPEIVDDWP